MIHHRRQVNVGKGNGNSWASLKQTIDQSQLGNKARNCWRI